MGDVSCKFVRPFDRYNEYFFTKSRIVFLTDVKDLK
ncbi:hypothetical protein SAMN05444396_10986 [Flavobacterium segetis]|uniref:Uncharacterized protein n=1 Tax=Flavobacterium segetis TaxID=271157 RepID=A0A1M5J4C4_9FLAO|nr:hypothetical protein SAMN05444396_10986 [Flavobacterium segetis]